MACIYNTEIPKRFRLGVNLDGYPLIWDFLWYFKRFKREAYVKWTSRLSSLGMALLGDNNALHIMDNFQAPPRIIQSMFRADILAKY